jgi:hypothetical protein
VREWDSSGELQKMGIEYWIDDRAGCPCLREDGDWIASRIHIAEHMIHCWRVGIEK